VAHNEKSSLWEFFFCFIIDMRILYRESAKRPTPLRLRSGQALALSSAKGEGTKERMIKRFRRFLS
jgi:hypothetical protein